MKTSLLSLLILATLPAFAQQREIRVVNGQAVDITPAIASRQAAGTNRLMAHWKSIRVLAIGEQVSSWRRCQITAEGQPKEVWLANLPAAIANPILRQDYVAARLSELAQAGPPRGVWGDKSGVTHAQAMAARNRELADLRLESKKSGPAAQAARSKEDWAMFTGKLYRGIEVWDCGRKGQ